MKYLIDTKILIWILIDTNKIPSNILDLIKKKENEIYLSLVSIWEIAIKISIGKLILPFELNNIIQEINELNINIIEIKPEHLIKTAELPFVHKDPFDRLIISKSIIENLPIITSDNNFKNYNVNLIW